MIMITLESYPDYNINTQYLYIGLLNIYSSIFRIYENSQYVHDYDYNYLEKCNRLRLLIMITPSLVCHPQQRINFLLTFMYRSVSLQ